MVNWKMTRRDKSGLILIALAYLSFVSLGLPDGLNGVAWPSIRAYFNLPVDALGALLVQSMHSARCWLCSPSATWCRASAAGGCSG